MSAPVSIRLEQVRKRYGPVLALDGVTAHVDDGEVLAMLGANGAGKSTLMRILATTVLPDSGMASVAGHDVVTGAHAARSSLGLVLGEERSFFWRLSGRKNLEFFAALHGMTRREARLAAQGALDAVRLADVGDRRVDRYSAGMRSRLGFARALLGGPEALLLDEPSRALDPLIAIELRELVRALASERGVSVLFTTHDLHEAAAVADRIVILSRGRVVREVARGTNASQLERILTASAQDLL